MNVVAQAMETNTPPEERRDSSSPHLSESSDESPFMALVDAAASLLDTKKSKSPKSMQVQAKAPLNTKMNNSVNITLVPETSSTTMEHDNKAKDPVTNGSETSSTTGHENKAKAPENSIPQIIKGTKENLVIDGSRKQSFAEHLMAVLNDEANSEVLSWMPDGKAFTITNHKKFTMNFMPKLFNIRNMSSFVRKLCRWGFQRVHEKETRNSDIFKHPFFVRGDPALVKKCKCVGRVTSNGTTTVTATNAPKGIKPVTPPTLARETFQPKSQFVYESTPSSQPREHRVFPPPMQQLQQHHQHQHQHHQQLPSASLPRNTHNYTHARNQYTPSNTNTSNRNIMNQHSMSSMINGRMFNLQGHHSSNMHSVHSQVVSAALEALQRDSARSSYRNTNNHVNNNVNSNNHVSVNNSCLQVPPQDFARRVTMPHQAVPYANDLSHNHNHNMNNSSRLMPVQLKHNNSRLMPVQLQLPSQPIVGGSSRGSGGRRNASGGRRVSWAAITSLPAESGSHPSS
jgi:hypothetical protein